LKILAVGFFDREELDIGYHNHDIDYPKDAMEFIERMWQNRLSSGTRLFDAKLFRVTSVKLLNQKLCISLENTSYRNFVGSRPDSFLSKFGADLTANPLSVGTLLATSDNYLMIGKRRMDLDFNPGKYSTIAGMMDRDKDIKNGTPDPFMAVIRELHEEKNIKWDDVKDLVCLGAVYSQEYNQTYLPFYARLMLSREEVNSRTPLENEFDEFFFIDTNDSTLSNWIKAHSDASSETFIANLLLFGGHEFGNDWRVQVTRSLGL